MLYQGFPSMGANVKRKLAADCDLIISHAERVQNVLSKSNSVKKSRGGGLSGGSHI